MADKAGTAHTCSQFSESPSLCGPDSHFLEQEWGCKLMLAVAFLSVFISAVNWERIT